MWSQFSDWWLYTKGRIDDFIMHLCSGGHTWDRVSMSICIARGHDVFAYNNAFCYNCQRTYKVGTQSE